jgi:arylsulfatase A-like enzyme
VANNTYCRVEHGIARGFSHYEDYVASVRELARNSSLIRFAIKKQWIRRFLGYYEWLDRKPAHWITNDFLKWVDQVPKDHPFFAFLNYFDAHDPYLCPEKYFCRFGPTNLLFRYLDRPFRERLFAIDVPDQEIESIRNAYDGCIAYIDEDLNRLFGELEQRDLFNRTLLIVVSDHGEEFREHGTIGHANDLYIQSIRVPLILRFPNIVPGDVTVQEPITLRDIPATVLDLLSMPNDDLFPGQSLGRFWVKSGIEELETINPVLSELQKQSWKPLGTPAKKGEMKSLVIGDLHYIHNGDGAEEVYDLHKDPGEQNNLIQTPHGAKMASQARIIIPR